MYKKIIAGLVALVAVTGLTACSVNSDTPLVKEGPFKGLTYTEALSSQGVFPPSPDYYKKVCTYMRPAAIDGRLSDAEYTGLIMQVSNDAGVSPFTSYTDTGTKIGLLIGISVQTGCSDYMRLFTSATGT